MQHKRVKYWFWCFSVIALYTHLHCRFCEPHTPFLKRISPSQGVKRSPLQASASCNVWMPSNSTHTGLLCQPITLIYSVYICACTPSHTQAHTERLGSCAKYELQCLKVILSSYNTKKHTSTYR